MSPENRPKPIGNFSTDPHQRYVLIRTEGGLAPFNYLVYDLRVHGYLLVEDDNIAQGIVRALLENDVPVYEEPPERGTEIIDFSALLMINGGMSANEANRWEKVLWEKDWKFTDELLRQGKKYPEIIDARVEFLTKEIDEHLRRFGLKE